MLSARKYTSIIGLALVCFFFGFAIKHLQTIPLSGLSDNGDFWRVMSPAGLELIDDSHHADRSRPVNRLFRRTEISWSAFFSSSPVPIAILSQWLPFYRDPQFYDIRNFSLLCLVLLGFAIVFLWRQTDTPLLAVGCLWISVDPGYLFFFNSFLADSFYFLGILFLLATIALLTSKNINHLSPLQQGAALLLLAGALFLSGFSKMQYLIVPVAVTATLLLSLISSDKTSFRVRGWATLVGLIFCFWAPAHFFLKKGPNFESTNNFYAVESGILRWANDPTEAAKAYHLTLTAQEAATRKLSEANRKKLQSQTATLSRGRLLWQYVIHPGAILNLSREFAHDMREAATTRHFHFERKVAGGPFQYFTRWQFSNVRSFLLNLFPGALFFLLLLSCLWFSYLAGKRMDPLGYLGVFLVLAVVTQFFAVLLGEGTRSLLRHLVGAKFSLDCLLAVLLCTLSPQNFPKWRSHSPS